MGPRPPCLVYRSHTIRHTQKKNTHTHIRIYAVGLVSKSDQFVAEAATYTTHKNKTDWHPCLRPIFFTCFLFIPVVMGTEVIRTRDPRKPKAADLRLVGTATGISTPTLTNRFT
jgi:hypothetical protein